MQRRSFLATSGAALGFFGLQKYLTASESTRIIQPYGPLLADPAGILDLPKGFQYKIVSKRGSQMSNDLRYQGFKAGAARFARGEGIQYTDGGPESQGQTYRLTPGKTDNLSLFLQPKSDELLTNGDNLCAAPWGDLFICEDLVNEHRAKTPHVRGTTPDGKIDSFAKNAKSTTEFADTCFSPDGSVLFVNMQGEGRTIAITRPWQNRA